MKIVYCILCCVLCSEKYEEVVREIELEALERATMEDFKQTF